MRAKAQKVAEGTLRFWWIPQVPMKPFYVNVSTVAEAALLYNAFSHYDLFQYENKVKPDYCNTGGLEVFVNGEWEKWESEDYETISTVSRTEGTIEKKKVP